MSTEVKPERHKKNKVEGSAFITSAQNIKGQHKDNEKTKQSIIYTITLRLIKPIVMRNSYNSSKTRNLVTFTS